MALCNTCSNLTFGDLCRGGVVFHESLRALARSAEGGCAFCSLCWTHLRRSISASSIDRCLADSSPAGVKEAEEDTPIIDFNVYLNGLANPPDDDTSYGGPSKLFLTCGKTENAGSVLSILLDVFAEPESPAASAIIGRYIAANRNPGLPLVVALTRKWVAYCRKNHKTCNDVRSREGRGMPARLIDVGEPGSARLILSEQLLEAQPYVALSYCWGEGTRNAIMLTDDNIDDLIINLPESRLTKTHQDAIQFTRSFGIRYLWVNSLCIKQGHTDDWESESKRMGTVYSNAELTIIAGRAADSREGFITNDFYLRTKTPLPVAIKCGAPPYNKRDVDLGPVYVTIPRSAAKGPVDERGWCFQEYMLSTNSICFGEG